ncbi:MAG: metal ABC transporter permease [Sporichthyaceae bacterium]|nr:metal ABC transporter permease [Sporichthyaceae bacterium]
MAALSPEFLQPPFMQRALLAAILVGMTAPAIGTYLVQRRMALMGDGIGHVALFGVAIGLALGAAPVLTAVLVATLGAIAIEILRERGTATGDVALALLFYGGIAGGVVTIGLSAGASNANLLAYLFGSLTTVSPDDVWLIAILAGLVLAVTLGLSRWLFTVCHDEEYAKVAGLPVRALNMVIAIAAAVTVTVAMRVVGVLLISALMVVPVATAQQLSRGFRTTLALALGLGVLYAVAGVIFSYYADTAPGASIVVLGILGFAVVSVLAAINRTIRSQRHRPELTEVYEDDVIIGR